jgi:hypothetical protein
VGVGKCTIQRGNVAKISCTQERRGRIEGTFCIKNNISKFYVQKSNSLEPFNLANEEGEMSVVEQHKRNKKKNHKILEEEDMITIMRKLRNKNKKIM